MVDMIFPRSRFLTSYDENKFTVDEIFLWSNIRSSMIRYEDMGVI